MVENGLNLVDINQMIHDAQSEKCAPINGEGIVLLKNFSKGITSTGNEKYSGVIANIEEAKFQIWNNKPAFSTLEEQNFVPGESVIKVTYEISSYGLIINTIEPIYGYNSDDFIYHRYNLDDKAREFVQSIKDSGATDKAVKIIEEILHMRSKDEVSKRIGREFAALSHHDNCETGLLAHMTKCIQLYNGIKVPYAFLKDERVNDLMVIALAVHDIGKIREMYNGTYQKCSFVTHRGFGMEHLLKHKETIIAAYDEEFFYMLYSVVQQHHDEFGEKAHTLYAFLIHMIDNMDATFTSFDEMIQNRTFITDESGKKLKYNEKYYSF